MRFLKYLLIAVFLLTGCTSVFGQDERPNPTQEQVRENIRKAEQGDAEAQNVLGLMYSLGLGVPPDKHEAVKWYRRAAEQGICSWSIQFRSDVLLWGRSSKGPCPSLQVVQLIC